MVTFTSILPWILLFLVILAVIFRRIGKLEIPAWTAFLIAAIVIVLVQPEGFNQAVFVLGSQADVFIFLFGMFVIVTALEMSGALQKGAKLLLNKAKTGRAMLLWILLGFGLAAAVLVNDTVAIIAPILLITFSKQVGCESKPLVITVALSLTFGSALLPTGNPQNFILAQAGNIGFLNFFLWALGPTIISLVGCYLLTRLFYRKDFSKQLYTEIPFILDKHEYEKLTIPALVSLGLILVGMIITTFVNFPMAYIILIVSGLFLFIRNERREILARLDWGVLLFFGGMFIVIDAVTNSSIFQDSLLPIITGLQADIPTFCLFVVVLFGASQIFSNVPVAIIVANILPGTPLDQPIFWITAALTTTFAGATTVLGAASNIIVLETSNKRGLNISWWEFTRVGFPISIISLIGIFVLGISYLTIAT
ncbi:MAG TPA: SLC13 family permease [Candidatus Bathyarchaeia archaeon]|nr:SLC13 family permease [Candidatus Bathyarchaeia archaeon]